MQSDVSWLFRATLARRHRVLADLPGPRPIWPWGNAWRFARRFPWEVLADIAPQYGPLFAIWIMNRPFVVVNDASLVERVLDTQGQDFYKADPVRAFRPLTPQGSLFIANDSQWTELRQADPYARCDFRRLHAGQNGPLHAVVRDWALETAKNAGSGGLAELGNATQRLQRLVFDCFAVALWGEKLGEPTYRDFVRMGHVGSRRVTAPPLAFLPPLDPRFYAARRRWGEFFSQRIEQARRARESSPGEQSSPSGGATAPRSDLLGMSLECGPIVDDEMFRTALASMFYGGVFSVTSAIVSTLECLTRHEDVARKVRDELHSRLGRGSGGSVSGPSVGTRPDNHGGDFQTLEQCEWLDAALRESLRLLCPVPVFLRNVRADRDVQLGDVQLPADTPLIISSWRFQRSAECWPDATEYRPERWLDGGRDRHPSGSSHFFPFGRGPRRCVGEAFGWFVMKRVLASLLLSGDIRTTGTWRPSFYFGVLMPKGLGLTLRGT